MTKPISKQIVRLLAASLLAVPVLASAQSAFTWNGGSGTTGNWSDGANWGGSGPANPQAFLNFNGTVRTSSTNDFAAGSPGYQIYFKSGANAFTLYGNSVIFYDFGGGAPNIQNEGAFTNQIINFPVVDGNLAGTFGVLNINTNPTTAQGPLTFNGTVSAADAAVAVRAINVYGSNVVTFNGTISDFSSSGKIAISQLGTGTTVLNATNTYTGDTTVNAGTVTVGGAGLLGNGLYAGTIANAGTFNYGGTNNQTLSGVLSGAGTVNKTGAGTLILSNANTGYTGAISIAGGTLVAANAGALGTAAGTVTFTGTAGTNTLVLQTDGGDTNKNISFGSTAVGSTVASDVKTGSVGINHTLGSLTTGNATLSIISGPNVASGSPAITFGTVSLSAGTAGTTILNPTTASLSLGAVSIASGSNPKTLQLDGTSTGNTVTGVIANGLNVLTVFKNNSSTWTLSNAGNSYSGNTSVGGGTLNLTGGTGVTNGFFVNNGGLLNLSGTFGTGSNNNNFIIGQAAGRGVLNIPAGATIPRANMFVGDGAAGDGAVYQTGGTVTLSQAAGIDNLRVGSTTGGKGYYRLTGGSVTAVRPAIGASLPDTIGVFEMTNGTFTATEQLHIAAGSATSSGLLNVLGGTVNAGTDIRMLSLQAGTAGAAQQAVLNVGGGTGAASVTTGNNAGQGMNLAQTANLAGELSVVNLLANGTLTTSRILGTQLNPTTHFNFNGGKLKANTTVANPLFNDSGVDAINVYTNGGTIDNSGVALTLGRPLLAPTGSGVSSIVGPATQGSNYIGAPLVVITGGTGSGATAYAVMADDGSGKTFKVASIVVTSPGNYTVAPTTVTLVGGGAGTVASGFGFNTAPNVSGGLTFTGSGATTLNGVNTYTGATAISAGELVGSTAGSLSNSAVTVASGATNGVLLATAGGQFVCSNLTFSAGTTYADFNFNGFAPSTTTAPLLVNGNLAFTGTPNIIVRSAGATAAGQYPLIKYTGTLSGTPPSVALSLPPRMSATIVNNVANNSIDLLVTVGNAVQWAVGNGAWDINTTANWKNSVGAAVNYLDADAVVLDDTASGASPITVSMGVTVTPTSITANLTNKNYTLSPTAPGGVFTGSGPLVKNGSGTLTVSTTNTTYTGSITLNGGALAVGAAASIGSGPITMNNGSTLSMPSTTATSVGNAITVAAGATATNTSGALGSSYSGSVSSGDGTSLLVVGGATSYGAASQMFSGFTGTVQVNSGATLRFSSTTGGASFGGSNTTFNINGTLQPRDQTHNSIIGALTGAGSLAGPQTQPTTAGTASYFIGSKNIDSTFSGTISDRTITNLTSVTKIGSATLTLSGNSPYSSATTVASGTLQWVTGGSCSNSSVTVNSGATNGVTITAPGGAWTCTNMTYAAGTANAVFAFGASTPSTTVAPLQVLNNLTISGTLNIIVIGSSTMPVGTYPLISYAGALAGTVPTVAVSLPPYVNGVIVNDTANKLISLNITSLSTPPALVWSAGTGTWDFSSLNWTNSAGATVAWADTSSALLDDTASGAGPFTVTLTTNVAPTGATFNNTTKDYTLTGTGGITGNNTLTKTGSGMLTLANSNSFAGVTTISGGTLQLGAGGTAGTLANMAIVDNGALVINHSDAVAISTVITGTGSFTNAGGGTTTVSVTNTYAGNTTVKAGTLQMTDSGNLAPASALVLAGGQFTRAAQNFTPARANAYKFGLAVAADSTVATTTTTTRTVHWDSSNISAVPGTTLLVTNAAATGTNHFRFYAGGFNYAGNLVLGGNGGNNMAFLESYNTNDTLPDQIFSGVISGPGRLYKNIEGSSPGGNLILSNAASTFAGGTELRAGYLGLGADSPLGTGRVTFGFDFNPLGLYAVDAPRTLTNDIYADVLSTSASTAAGCTNLYIKGSQNLTLSGRIFIHTNVQFFIVNNTALTTFSGIVSNAATTSLGIAKLGAGTLALAGNNAYSGDTRVNAGILRLGAGNVIPDGAGKGNVSVSAMLDLNTFNETINGLSGAGVIDTVAGGSPVLTVGNNNVSSSFGGVLQNTAGSLALTKTGSGILTLTGAHTLTGTTTVGGGTLALSGPSVMLASANIAVAAGALFDVSGVPGGFTLGAAQTLSGFGSVNGTLTNNGVIAPGASIGTLTLSNTPVLNGTVVLELNRTNVQNADLLNVTAPLALGGSLTVTNVGDALQLGDTFTVFSATSYSGSFSSITLPSLAPALAWNTANLTNNGSITVVLAGTPPVVASLTPLNPTAQCSGSVNFTVVATGTGPISYQWNTNGTPVSGETSTNFTLGNVHFPTPITVSVTLTNGFGTVSSNSVVTIIDTIAPAITVLGGNPATNQCHSTYTDAGATALDSCAGSVIVSSSSTVDANTPGSYTVTYSADDGSGNTNTATRTVVVIDTTAPVITYNFTNLNLSCGIAMPDVTGTNHIVASDACSASVTITQTPTNGAALALGTNEVILAVSDSTGNVAYSTNTVTLSDITAPVITLLGASPATNECHVAYSDAGATALDGCSLTVNFSTNNSVNANLPGSYSVTYTADDGRGNTNTLSRMVVVIDTAAPTIILLGTSPVTNECHVAYSDAGATANDACAGSVSVSSSSTVNTNVPGSYTVTYTADDGAGHTNTATRTVVVVDTTAPAISLLGTSPVTNECHVSYTDAGATANDTCAGSVSVSSNSTVNANVPGSYTVTYTADDGNGNTNTLARNVVVVDTLPPVITVLGANPATNQCHSAYTDAGATANDACAGSVSLASNSTVNANVPGSYTVTYTSDDGAGHTNTATRTVVVIDTTAPLITVLGANPATNYANVPFVDPGATASDSCAGSLNVATNGIVDITTPATYTLEYVAVDPSGNSVTNTRTVVVLELVAPVITSQQLLGNGAFEVTFTGPEGQPYTLLSSTDLTLPQVSWTTLTNSTFGPSATVYPDTTATNDTIRFYRVRSP